MFVRLIIGKLADQAQPSLKRQHPKRIGSLFARRSSKAGRYGRLPTGAVGQPESAARTGCLRGAGPLSGDAPLSQVMDGTGVAFRDSQRQVCTVHIALLDVL